MPHRRLSLAFGGEARGPHSSLICFTGSLQQSAMPRGPKPAPGPPGLDVRARLSSMLAELRHRCPTLCPSVTPAGYADAAHGTAFLALCDGADEHKALLALLGRARAAAAGRCALTHRQVAEDELRFASLWDLHPERRAYRLLRGAFVCADAHVLLHPAAFFERFTRASADCAKLDELALLFCRANGDEARGKDAFAARVWLQECMNLAYACTVLASSLAPWHVVGEDFEPLPSTAVMCAKRILGVPIAKRAIGKSPKSREGGKSMRKKRKSEDEEHPRGA
ncbi:hypothetical protein AB1Y20_022065 [Prymnesium parvum]|uniref:Uncharacterized protein n=1 Tax=Prymnesium parvum TaxID=97485 RepID=A0AB34JES9_PRYPA